MGKAKPIPAFDPEAIKRAMAPVVAAVPSQKVHHGEVLEAERPPRTVGDFAMAIAAEWEGAQERFLRIGELLHVADLTLTAEADRKALAELLPFGKSARSQLLTAYRAIQSGRVPRAVAAAGYSTVYLLAGIADDERPRAEAAGLFRKDVTKAEVQAFKRAQQPPAEADELAQIDAEIARLEDRLVALRRRRAGLSG